jgi:hypothetical protein
MLHLVYNELDIQILNQVIELDDSLMGDIFLLRDDYSIGPLREIFTEEGFAARKNWWADILAGSDFASAMDKNPTDDRSVLNQITEYLDNDEDSVLWIWMAQNKHDVCGYYWLASQLKQYQGRIYVVFLNNLPFINDKGQLFYPEWIAQILPKELLKAKRLSRVITPSEFEVDPDEWTKICQDERTVRILEGGKKLSLHPENYYDAELKKFITDEWQKGSKIIHQFSQKSKNPPGEPFLLWRLKQLLQTDLYDVQGAVQNMKDFEVKKKAGVLFENEK